MRPALLVALGIAVSPFATVDAYAQTPSQITVLYDAFGPPSALKLDWGFAALIEYQGKRVLFDTGNNGKIFEHNVQQLQVDLKQLDAVLTDGAAAAHAAGAGSHLG